MIFVPPQLYGRCSDEYKESDQLWDEFLEITMFIESFCIFLNVLMLYITNSAAFFSIFWLDPVYVDLQNIVHEVNKKDKMKLLHHTSKKLNRKTCILTAFA